MKPYKIIKNTCFSRKQFVVNKLIPPRIPLYLIKTKKHSLKKIPIEIIEAPVDHQQI